MDYLVSTVPKRLQCLRGQRPSNPTLFRVPEEKRESCKSLYCPKTVVLGPYHRQQETEDMRNRKLFFFKDFLSRSTGHASFDAYWTKTKQMEATLSGFYSGVHDADRIQFLEMLLVDAVFILEIMLQHHEGRLVANLPDYVCRTIKVDLIMAENQIPCCILTELFKVLCESSSQPIIGSYPNNTACLGMHFFGFIIPPENQQSDEMSHLLHLFYVGYVMQSPSQTDAVVSLDTQLMTHTVPSATNLKEVRVRFVSSPDGIFFLVRFEDGTLKVPRVVLDDSTKCILTNLVAFEEWEAFKNQ